MKSYSLTPLAEDDMQGIWNYIHERNPTAADKVVQRISEKFKFLSRVPKAGSTCEDLPQEPRSFTVGSYMVYYREFDEEVIILRVLHGSRDAANLLEELE